MSARPALAPLSVASTNSRTSIGPARGVPRKSTLPSGPMATMGGSSMAGSTSNRKSLGGKEDQNKGNGIDSRRSMIPAGPSTSRPSLAAQSRIGVPRPSLMSRPSLSTNRRNSRGSLNPANGRYVSFFPLFLLLPVCIPDAPSYQCCIHLNTYHDGTERSTSCSQCQISTTSRCHSKTDQTIFFVLHFPKRSFFHMVITLPVL